LGGLRPHPPWPRSLGGDKTKARFKYPFAKGDRLYRSAFTAIRQRAAQQQDGAIERVAGQLLEQVDKPKSSGGRPERKAFKAAEPEPSRIEALPTSLRDVRRAI
jgi:hypothetical protein